MANPNFRLLVDAAKLLKPILGELVFVGGCTTTLLITDKAAADVRPTYDVDAIAEITSYVGYAKFSERLKAVVRRNCVQRFSAQCNNVLLKGMSREKCSPSARCRCFFLGIQPNRLNVDSESGLPQALRPWFVSTGAEKQFFPLVPFRCCDGARRGLKQQAWRLSTR
jgi:hypothetical protein